MDTLPNELILLIFNNIQKITDKRQFLKTCMKYNILTKQEFLNYENNYRVRELIFENLKTYSVEKFTLELCNDSYFDIIPISYITPINRIIVKALIIFNCLAKLKIAKENDCKFELVCFYASIYGHLDILKWARENNYHWDSLICTNAAFYGHFELLKWAHENGCRWNSDTCANAARNGYLEILKWAIANGCKWTAETCSNAAAGGYLDVLKWARGNGCDWDVTVCSNAKNNGHLELLKWAIDNGCPQN